MVGLISLYMFKDWEIGRLYYDIEELIWECKVEYVVFLMDVDCWDISEKVLVVGEDILKCFVGFYSVVKKFWDFIVDILELENCLKVYYYVVEAKDLGNFKGLDDVMRVVEQARCLEDLVEEALIVSFRSNKYFFKQEIFSKVVFFKL